jgi:hypothetical protein
MLKLISDEPLRRPQVIRELSNVLPKQPGSRSSVHNQTTVEVVRDFKTIAASHRAITARGLCQGYVVAPA